MWCGRQGCWVVRCDDQRAVRLQVHGARLRHRRLAPACPAPLFHQDNCVLMQSSSSSCCLGVLGFAIDHHTHITSALPTISRGLSCSLQLSSASRHRLHPWSRHPRSADHEHPALATLGAPAGDHGRANIRDIEGQQRRGLAHRKGAVEEKAQQQGACAEVCAHITQEPQAVLHLHRRGVLASRTTDKSVR